MPSQNFPDWQLPPGVSRDVWQYAHNEHAARTYDASLAGSPLFDVDQRFAERHLPGGGRLIDLGCGTGRLLIHFARGGRWALGVDLSAEMLRIAGEKAAQAGVTVERLQANLVALDCLADASFDGAACLFSTLGMITGAAERRKFIADVYRILRPGSRFVLHVHNRWFNAWDAAGRRWLLMDLIHRTLRRPNAGDRPAAAGAAGFALHHFSRGEAARLLREAGFGIRETLPVAATAGGALHRAWWFGWLRSYGYLFAAQKPAN